jgi:CBS domain-containing protein
MPHLNFTQPPFDVLSSAERQSLKKKTQVRYLATDESLTKEDLQYFFVVLKGQVEQTLSGDFVTAYLGSNHSDHLNSNDWFDSRRMPESQDNAADASEHYHYRANEDTLLLQVDGVAIDNISAQNHLVRQLLSDKLPERLKALQQRRGTQGLGASSYTDQQEVQQIMLQPVTDVTLLPVHIIEAKDSLHQAARTMTEARLKHVLVRPTDHLSNPNSSDRALGILTDTDICRAVSEQQDMSVTPCQDFASFNLRTVDNDHEIGDALLTMTRYRIHRLPVIDDSGHVIGVLGQSDVLAYLGHHSQLISVQIEQAEDLDSLDTAVELIGRYIRAQQQNGVKIGIVSRMVQTLNAQVFTKLWKIIVPNEVMQNTCVIVMGSEGRGEQIMRTDQDNALIIRDGFSHPHLQQYAETFNKNLAELGYPLCDGNIMMNNPMWRKPLKEFNAQISLWFRNTDPIHSIYLSAILDGEYVCGDEALLTQVREHLKKAHRQADPMFIRQFARAALQFGEVNQWWQKFVPLLGKQSSSAIDLKKSGIFPLVHGIRALALEQDILQVPSSKNRLKSLVQARILTQERADTLNEALEFFMAQRLDVALLTEDKYARHVDPMTLSALERDVLKECLAVVKSFKAQLRQHYQLEIG